MLHGLTALYLAYPCRWLGAKLLVKCLSMLKPLSVTKVNSGRADTRLLAGL